MSQNYVAEALETISHARLAANWLRRNEATFMNSVAEPHVLSDEEAREWVERVMLPSCVKRVEHDEMLGRMRDRGLFDFQNAADLVLFVKLVTDGLQLYTCVCLQGSQYIGNSVGDLLQL